MESRIESPKSEWSSGGKSIIDRAVSEVKNIDPEEVRRSAREITSRVRDASNELYDDAIGYARRNPVRTALGMCALGFVAGMMTRFVRRSA